MPKRELIELANAAADVARAELRLALAGMALTDEERRVVPLLAEMGHTKAMELREAGLAQLMKEIGTPR